MGEQKMNIKKTTPGNMNINCLIYGQAGSGKTTLAGTVESPLILSAEAGLLSIAGMDLAYAEIGSITDMRDAYAWLKSSQEASEYKTIFVDSISEIGEVVLASEKKLSKDPRQAYGNMAEVVTDLMRAFRDLPYDVVMISKLEKVQDEMGRMLYSPSMPGNKVGQGLPYLFDEVLALRVEKNDEGTYRVLQTASDGCWLAKDRSGKLEQWEAPDLGAVIDKIRGQK
jgi:hypothetical protein